jgi:pimeloyl-ACP methyl ester carboxylesterase
MNVRGEGEPVLLLAPAPKDALVELLATRFRVIVPDEPGLASATLDEMAIGRCAIVGVSSGAAAAVALALEGRADALVLVAPRDVPLESRAFAEWEFPVLIFGGEEDAVVP